MSSDTGWATNQEVAGSSPAGRATSRPPKHARVLSEVEGQGAPSTFGVESNHPGDTSDLVFASSRSYGLRPFEDHRRKYPGSVSSEIAGIEAASERKVSRCRPAERVERWKMDQLAELDDRAQCDGPDGTPRQPDCRPDRSDPPRHHGRPERVAEDVAHIGRQGTAAAVHGQAEYDRT